MIAEKYISPLKEIIQQKDKNREADDTQSPPPKKKILNQNLYYIEKRSMIS